MTAYALVLLIHSYLRWAVLGLALTLLLRTFAGWRRGGSWSPSLERLHAMTVGVVDLQFLLGLLLYVWLSPFPRAFFGDLKSGMRDSSLRFFGLEHIFAMLIAVAVLHIGRARSKRAPNDAARHKRTWISALVFVLLVLASIPWPGSKHGRPLLRGLEAAAAPAVDAQASCPPVFSGRCASCHGAQGHGDGVAGRYLQPAPRDFASESFRRERSDAQILAVIRDGGAAHGLSAAMPTHADLSPTELNELVACVRALGK